MIMFDAIRTDLRTTLTVTDAHSNGVAVQGGSPSGREMFKYEKTEELT